MAIRLRFVRIFIATFVGLSSGCWGDSEGRPELGVGYDEVEQRILVTFGRGLEGGETLHARVRRGLIEELDCGRDAGGIERIDGEPVQAKQPTWRGPFADAPMFESLYDTSWLESEWTPEMLAEAALGGWIIDVCLMNGAEVVRGQAFDIRRALDQNGGDGKFDGEDEERIASTVAYAEACTSQMGEIPFFEALGGGDYSTFNCLDGVAIPMTVTGPDGQVTRPEEPIFQCDNPQYIYSSCEPNAVSGRTNGPRVAQRTNDQGTHWVLLCRKANQAEGAYRDIAMIGHNPYSGKTCFFQNALGSRTDGLHVPHPGDKVRSSQSEQESATLWEGIHGGLGSTIECAACHSNDPFIHTPWIDGALDQTGDPVIPKMGIDDDFVLGFNDAPYAIVNLSGQGWTMPEQLVSPEAAACTKCHRMSSGRDRWMSSWVDRLVGEDPAWTAITTDAYRSFAHTFWMPPDLVGLNAETWPGSEYGRAVSFILGCRANPSACQTAPLPTSPISDNGELPAIELEGRELAQEALKILGADIDDPTCPGGNCRTRRCSECHSVSRTGLRRWHQLTDHALADCNLRKDAAEMSPAEAKTAVDCLRVEPADDGSVFEAAKLGVLTTGVQYTYFRRLFQKAYGEEGWLLPYGQFHARIGMPKGSHPKLSQKEYATLLKWFQGGLDRLDEVLEEPPPPATCSETIDTGALSAHVAAMRLEGWGAANAESGIRMYGCPPGATDPRSCLTSLPDRTSDWGGGAATLRELTQLTFRTSFWTRSSADGRYVGNGGGMLGATITDLQGNRNIAVDAAFDPGFFPDNSGFIFQDSVAGICAQSLLANDDTIDFSEPQCMKADGINLYQHVARALGGGDYFVINSEFATDSGHASQDPGAYFNANSTMKFTPMIFNGTTYDELGEVIVDSPFQGDSVLSPSSRLVVSRLAGADGRALGYMVRRVVATRFGSNYVINIDEHLATVCMSGAKPAFSFDERFIVTHHYTSGKSDVYLVDLLSGQRHQITNMPSGSYAMYPHFRSDGWIYFLVSDRENEWVGASDAALRL